MIPAGFWLTRVRVSGPNVPDAEVSFGRGLNVISGPSNTGKTYIAQCINFALGSSSSPKDIPEAVPYDTVSVSITDLTQARHFLLERSLRGGEVRLIENGLPNENPGVRVLGAKHQEGRDDTLSHFLLTLSDLAGRRVCRNKKGTTRDLSFRDIAHLILVGEEEVIRERSPALSGQFVNDTVEKSVFRLLLTGIDDSSVVQREDQRVASTQRETRTEVLTELRAKVESQLEELTIEGTTRGLIEEQVERLDALFNQASDLLAAEKETVTAIEERRRDALQSLRQAQSRLDVLVELQRRFSLLREQYSSDLRRLEAISEAGIRLDQMKEERCPLCGALPENHDRTHGNPGASPDAVARACRAEADKTRASLRDLQSTLQDNSAEIEVLEAQRARWKTELETVGTEVQSRMQPRLQEALQRLRDSQVERDRYRRVLDLHDQIRQIDELLSTSGHDSSPKDSGSVTSSISASAAEDFSKEVEFLLRDWSFPELDRVTFNETTYDLVISGRPRSSHGKGVRAVTHAAFTLGLLRYCANQEKPHPGLVLIDSPLVVYRQPDAADHELASVSNLKDAFYRSSARHFENVQVLILENEDPPEDLGDRATVIRFTGTSAGRKGFIPAKKSRKI